MVRTQVEHRFAMEPCREGGATHTDRMPTAVDRPALSRTVHTLAFCTRSPTTSTLAGTQSGRTNRSRVLRAPATSTVRLPVSCSSSGNCRGAGVLGSMRLAKPVGACPAGVEHVQMNISVHTGWHQIGDCGRRRQQLDSIERSNDRDRNWLPSCQCSREARGARGARGRIDVAAQGDEEEAQDAREDPEQRGKHHNDQAC